MEPVRESWTDERLDDLNHRVGELGRRMDDGFRDLRQEMNGRFDAMDAKFESRFDAMDTRFDAMQRTMIQFGGLMFAALLGIIATQLGLIFTQL